MSASVWHAALRRHQAVGGVVRITMAAMPDWLVVEGHVQRLWMVEDLEMVQIDGVPIPLVAVVDICAADGGYSGTRQ